MLKMSSDELCLWIGRFIHEVRRQDKLPYMGESLYQIVCGLQRYMRENGYPEIDFFSDAKFRYLKNVLDSRMKQLRKDGVGTDKNQAEPISSEEDLLWKKSLLGEHSPVALRNLAMWDCLRTERWKGVEGAEKESAEYLYDHKWGKVYRIYRAGIKK